MLLRATRHQGRVTLKLLFMSDGSVSKSLDRIGEVPIVPRFPWHSTDPELSQPKTFNKRLWMTDGSREEAEGEGWSGKIPAGMRAEKASQVPLKSGILCRGVSEWPGTQPPRLTDACMHACGRKAVLSEVLTAGLFSIARSGCAQGWTDQQPPWDA